MCIFWSTTFLAIRIGLETLPPFSMVSGARYIVAGLILGVFVLSRGTALPSRDSWPGHAVLGFLMLGVGNGGLVWAEQWVPSGMAAVMVAAIPFWMVGIEALLPAHQTLGDVRSAEELATYQAGKRAAKAARRAAAAEEN